MAGSAAATANADDAGDWPIVSSKSTGNTGEFGLAAGGIDSVGVGGVEGFWLFGGTPPGAGGDGIVGDVG